MEEQSTIYIPISPCNKSSTVKFKEYSLGSALKSSWLNFKEVEIKHLMTTGGGK